MSNHCRPPHIVYVSHLVTLPAASQTFPPELNSQMRNLQIWKADYTAALSQGGAQHCSVCVQASRLTTQEHWDRALLI